MRKGRGPDLEPQLLPVERDLRRPSDRHGYFGRDPAPLYQNHSYRLREKVKAGLIKEPEVEKP
jgi:hypothetical protein